MLLKIVFSSKIQKIKIIPVCKINQQINRIYKLNIK